MVKKFLFLCSATSIMFCAEIKYAQEVKPIFESATSSKVIGKLLPTNDVEILATEGNRIKFKVTGYEKPDAKKVIYFAKKSRILKATFAKTAKVDIKIIKKGPEGKDGWNEVAAVAYTTKNAFSNQLKPMMQKAKKLYSENCSMCHSLHNTTHYSANQWPGLFKSMVARTPIDKKDTWLVAEYLQKHSKDFKGKD